MIRTICKPLTGRGGWGRQINPYTDDHLKHNETKVILYFRSGDGIAPEHLLLISLTQLPHIIGVLGVRFASLENRRGVVSHANDCKEVEAEVKREEEAYRP